MGGAGEEGEEEEERRRDALLYFFPGIMLKDNKTEQVSYLELPLRDSRRLLKHGAILHQLVIVLR